MLDALPYPRLIVHHGERNMGFGQAVNQAVARTRSDLVLVLNSDVSASDDFIAPLHAALVSDPLLAAVMPSGNTFENYDMSQYALRAGCVTTYNLHAYAFLMRRGEFEAVGGFDPAYGRGYFEDRDLSRKLVAKGRSLAIHPGSVLYHRIHGSFEAVPSFRKLIASNRALYLERYPGAARHVLIATARTRLQDLGVALHAELRTLLEEGGSAHWLTRSAPRSIPALEVTFVRWGVRGLRRTARRHRHKPHQRFTELWIAKDVSVIAASALRRWGAVQGLRVRNV